MAPFSSRRIQGLSIIELLVVLALVSLIASLLVPLSGKFKKRAEKAACISKMRTLHTCFMGYVGEKGEWPQLPVDREDDWTEDDFYKFWIASLEPYGASAETWLCPSDKLLLQMKKSEIEKRDRYFGTYVPTPFDVGPGTPLRWNQPWLIERGDFHGRGAHMLMPDGSVHDSQNPFHGR